jgi:thymidylate synthase (FAD)
VKVELIWITPDAERLIVHMARVSNPSAQTEGHDPARLIRYLVRHKHWSPFEMASACFEITTTRDIARQILRHRSFSFQEFSQRYAEPSALGGASIREARLQDVKNRQNSIETTDENLRAWWRAQQMDVQEAARIAYDAAVNRGMAKEVARAVLPEGLTASRMYMAGTVRSWRHYCELRTANDTQKEHRDIACAISAALNAAMPNVFNLESVDN